MTTVFVTHDQQEALSLADRVAIMEGGVCRQIGSPEEVYTRPSSEFVARFLGRANVLSAKFMGWNDDAVAVVRPEGIVLGEGPRSGVISRAVFEGAIVSYSMESEGETLNVRQFHNGKAIVQPGTSVRFTIPDEAVHRIRR